jgi:hypothetical protein
MSPQTALRASARFLVGLSLVIAALPMAPADAEAGRMKGAAMSGGGAAVRHHNRSSEEKNSTAEPAIEDATAAAEGGEAGGPVRAQAVVKTKPIQSTPKEIDVPGCSPGMICTVCLAGCNGAVNVIVHAVPKQK